MPRKIAETTEETKKTTKTTKTTTKKKATKTTKKPETTKKEPQKETKTKKTTRKTTKKTDTKTKAPVVSTQNQDIENIIRYLKNEPTPENYEKYVVPLVKLNGKQYADKLIGSTIIVLKERGLSLDDIIFDENDNLTVVKQPK